MKRNQSDNLPVAEIIKCNVMGQQTIMEIDGRLKFLRIGDKLYTQPSQVAQPEQLEGDAKDAERYQFLEHQCRTGTYRGIISRKAIDEAIANQKATPQGKP